MPAREVLLAETRENASHKELQSLSASARAIQKEIITAEEIRELVKERSEANLGEINVRIEEAWCEAETARIRRDLWQDLRDRRRTLLPAGQAEGERLRELELELLDVEIVEAEALLGKLDEELGNLIIRAQFEGVVDQVLVASGDVAEEDMPLASYFDPSKQWVSAYATPELAGKDLAGRPCILLPEGGGDPIDGRVASVGWVWVPCPPQLPQQSGHVPDFRLPVRIECRSREDLESFRPNTRMKVVFSGMD